MTLSFARDRGFGPVSAYIAPIHPRLKVPVWSIVWVSVWCVIFGLICKFIQLHAERRPRIVRRAQRDSLRRYSVYPDIIRYTQYVYFITR